MSREAQPHALREPGFEEPGRVAGNIVAPAAGSTAMTTGVSLSRRDKVMPGNEIELDVAPFFVTWWQSGPCRRPR